MTTTAPTPAPRPPLSKVAVVMLAFGVALIALFPVGLIVGGIQTKHKVEPVPGGLTTTGTVREALGHQGQHGTYYTPRIYYTAADGSVHFLDGPSVSDKPTIGSRVTVSYDPADPEHASDISASKTGPTVAMYIGVMLAILEVYGVVWFIRRRRSMRRLKDRGAIW
jgi:hypothetical protein